MTGFFEESVGVRSMTRFVMFALIVLAALIVASTCVYLLKQGKDASASVILAMATFLGVVAVKAIYAIKNRNAPADTDAPVQ